MNSSSRSSFTLRPALASDAPEIAELGARVFAATVAHAVESDELTLYLQEFYSTASILKDLADDLKTIFVATDETNRVVGFTYLTRGSDEPCLSEVNYKIELQRIYIDPAAQGKGLAASLACSGHPHDEENWTLEDLAELEAKWGQTYAFSGISTFGNLEYTKCLVNPDEKFDIAIIGAPFDTSVGYRPGARFGPRAIRHVSGRQSPLRGFNPRAGINPYQSWAKIIDCGDIPLTPFDNGIALEQMTQAFKQLGRHQTVSGVYSKPKLITLGGDHSLSLPVLRALNEIHGGPVQVLHFDAHLDTWHPEVYPSYWGTTHFTHGSMFWMAYQEGLLCNSSTTPSVHAGLRSRLGGTDWKDDDDDSAQNWLRIPADEIDNIGPRGIVDHILNVLGTEKPVYLSVDIDVLDPAFAPGTGTPEPGGWSSRELISILRGLADLNLVGADVVEVSPVYQNRGEETSFAAAQVVYELLTSMVKRGLRDLAQEIPRASHDKDEL
ncbi:hypothetical protein CNMCM5878_003942 [Aspergillus fumigatiaffinis]|nr:hypothetical protein CNMCM5878_003942 [Aspergillus fumigatiaffinis]